MSLVLCACRQWSKETAVIVYKDSYSMHEVMRFKSLIEKPTARGARGIKYTYEKIGTRYTSSTCRQNELQNLAKSQCTVLRMRIHVHFEFGGHTNVPPNSKCTWIRIVLLIGEVGKSLCGAKGKHSVDKKADWSEQREWSLVEGKALRQAERHRERRRLKQVSLP